MRPITHALVRPVSRSLDACALAHRTRQHIDVARARQEHAAYVTALGVAGVHVTVLPDAPELPDATFVEDAAIVLDELAVVGRPALASRQPEVEAIAQTLASIRPVFRITAPGTLEGGDVLRAGRTLFVGRSERTNDEGITQLTAAVARFDYRIVPVTVANCLHLKTGATSPADGLLLLNPAWVDTTPFAGWKLLPVPGEEPWGANVLPVNDLLFAAASAPRTAALLRERGLQVTSLAIEEIQKAEAGLTCLSILW